MLPPPQMPPHQITQQPPTIEINDDNTPPVHNMPESSGTVSRQHLDDIVSASVAAAFHEQYQKYGPQQPCQALEATIPNKAPAIMGIKLTNMYSWCGLTDGDLLPPFWKAFNDATTDSRCMYVLDAYLKDAQ